MHHILFVCGKRISILNYAELEPFGALPRASAVQSSAIELRYRNRLGCNEIAARGSMSGFRIVLIVVGHLAELNDNGIENFDQATAVVARQGGDNRFVHVARDRLHRP